MGKKLAGGLRLKRVLAGWVLLFPVFLYAGNYSVAYWREPGSYENHGNHSAYVHVWDENGQPLSGKQIYTSWGVLLGATDANGFVEIELLRPNGYDFQVRDPGHTTETTPVLSVERAPDWGHYSYEVGFLFKQSVGNPGLFETNFFGTINDSSSALCDLSAPCTRSLSYYSTFPSNYCSDPYALGNWTGFHGQTFVATGNRVVAVKAMMAAGYNVHYYWTAQIFEGGPNGAPIGPARSTRLMVDGEYFPILVKWGINEVQVVPGRTYFLKISVTGGVNAWRVNQDNYTGGKYYEGNVSVPGAELMGMVLCASYTNGGPAGDLVGSVRDSSNQPIAGAVVSIPDVNLYAISEADGNYWLPLVPAGGHDISATKAGYTAGLNRGVIINAGVTNSSSFNLGVQATNSGSGIITNGNSYLQPFEVLPVWNSSYDATWGNAATFTLEAGGQSGTALEALRTGPGSSARVQVFAVRPNTPYSVSVWMRCPSFSSGYWVEYGYKLGNYTAQDFDGNASTWSLVRKFSDTGENGNGNVWRQYSVNFNSGANSLVSLGIKLGAASGTGPIMRWDQAAIVSLTLPGLGLAVANSASNLTVQFSEGISESAATNLTNYTLTAEAGNVRLVSAAVFAISNVVIATEPQPLHTDLTLTVSNVPNPLQLGTLTGRNGQLSVRVPFSMLVPNDTTLWKYDVSGADPGNVWRARDFDDGAWPAGAALLGSWNGALPESIRAPLANLTNTVAGYFRVPFVVPVRATNAILRLRPLIADGAVFWVNGTELFRLGLTNNPVTFLTTASRAVSLPAYEGPYDLFSASLVPGTNLLAVEVHKFEGAGAGLVCGAGLEALILPSQFPAPLLFVTAETNAASLSWSEPGMLLETATNLAGPWFPQPGIVSPAKFTRTNRAAFFRLRQ